MKKFVIQERITQKDTETLPIYLREISSSKYDPISSDQELELSKKAQKGDQTAIDKLVCSNLRFAVSVAKSYQGCGLPLSDLIDEANIGLIKAVSKFDHKRGFKLISYAVWWIRQNILQSIAQNGKMVRMPVNQVNVSNKINKVTFELEQELGRVPTTHEIAEKLSVKEKDILAIDIHKSVKSFSSPINDEESSTLEDTIMDEYESADKSLIQESLKKEIERSLNQFSDRDKTIIKMAFGIDHEYSLDNEQIAEKYGLTAERIRQIKKKAKKVLKENQTLKSFL